MDKIALKTRMMTLEARELEAARQEYAQFVDGARIDGSEPIDTQEESQAMQSRTFSEAFEGQVHDYQREMETLKRIDFGPKAQVVEGAVVKFAGRYFVIGVATGVFSCEGRQLMGISTRAPIYEAIEGLHAGEGFEFGGREHIVEEVI